VPLSTVIFPGTVIALIGRTARSERWGQLGSTEMPNVSPGQIAGLPYWLETCVTGASHPRLMEKGRRFRR
jgi:hypothetical protein